MNDFNFLKTFFYFKISQSEKFKIRLAEFLHLCFLPGLQTFSSCRYKQFVLPLQTNELGMQISSPQANKSCSEQFLSKIDKKSFKKPIFRQS